QWNVVGAALLGKLQDRAHRSVTRRASLRVLRVQGSLHALGALGAHALQGLALLQQGRSRRSLRGARATGSVRARGACGVSSDALVASSAASLKWSAPLL